MSTTTAPPENPDPDRYTEGPDRYIRFAEEVLGVRLTELQREILRALVEHERVLAVGANGVGKSYTVAVGMLSYLATNLDSLVIGTSGSYSQFVDAAWRPLKSLHKTASRRVGLPGTARDGGQPELRLGEEWYAKIVSPRDPGDLEGRHAAHTLVVIEEADKQYITPEHFDSAGSLITDGNDRMLAVANPPEDEADVVYDKMQSDRWHTIRFSSFDAQPVRVELGEATGEKIRGLLDVDTLRDDWEAWNAEDWPGLEAARTAHERRDDLDSRWYRRRAGIIPPAGASAHRPFDRAAVEAAWDRNPSEETSMAQAFAVDVARSGGDETVAAAVHGDALRLPYAESGTDHMAQADTLTDRLQAQGAPLAVDAVGEGSGLADILNQRFGGVIRYKAGGTPAEATAYDDCWAEAAAAFGQWLADGGSIDDRRLREELLVAARTLEYEERHLASRGRDGAEVLRLTSKSEVKDRLGRSPDRLDAAFMAVWARDAAQESGIATGSVDFSDAGTAGGTAGDDDDTEEDGQTWGDVLRGAVDGGGRR